MKKETYDKIMASIEKSKVEMDNLNKDSRILVVDGLNTFLRCFTVSPAMNDDGLHIGGITGFLKSVGYAIRKLKPTRCIIVFDGKGGSQRRRKMYPDYKKGRKARRNYNRAYEDDLEDPEEAMIREMHSIGKYLKTLPVTTVSIDSIEADDSIAYIAKQVYQEDDNHIYIMSSDKDFLQLVDDRIKVWAPKKKKVYSKGDVEEDHGYPAQNYLMTRLIEGDRSDNISGVNGIGPKRIEKRLGDFLKCEEFRKVDDLLEYAEKRKDESNTYKRILDHEDTLRLNWRLMQLHEVDISAEKKLNITDIVESPTRKLDRKGFQELFMNDKLWGAFPSLNSWLTDTFLTLDNFADGE